MRSCLWILASVLLVSSYTVSAIDVAKIKSQLEKILQEKDIPDNVAKFIAVLHDSIDILKCIPTTRQGNCYRSPVCTIPKFKIAHKPIDIVLTVCKKPYKLVINFVNIDVPGWATLDLKPLVVNFNNDVSGSLTINSDTEMKLKVRHVHIRVAKARLMINGFIRYDCTKPRGSDWIKRAVENEKAPNRQYNALHYNLKIRVEIKVKKFDWGKLKYHCKFCEDVVNKSGMFGYGPQSCIAEAAHHMRVVWCFRACRKKYPEFCRMEPDDCENICWGSCLKSTSF